MVTDFCTEVSCDSLFCLSSIHDDGQYGICLWFIIDFLSKMVAQFIEEVSGVRMCMWLTFQLCKCTFKKMPSDRQNLKKV